MPRKRYQKPTAFLSQMTLHQIILFTSDVVSNLGLGWTSFYFEVKRREL